MRIAICNIQMSARTGTEIVTRDVALGLLKRGHEIHVLTGHWGGLCEELTAAGVFVHLDFSSFPKPDAFHINHLPFAGPALDRFEDVPALVMCHDANGTNAQMRPSKQVRAWAGVSNACCSRVAAEAEIPKPDVIFLPNTIDFDRVPAPRTDLPRFPRRWLYVGEKQFGERLEAKLRRAAGRLLATLDVVGPFPSVPEIVENLPAFARDYDLVVASGRCAIECAAMGVGVVVGDPRGIAGFLGPKEWEKWNEHNLGLGCLDHQSSSAVFAKAAWRWNRQDIRKVTEIVRRERPLTGSLDKLETIYRSFAGSTS